MGRVARWLAFLFLLAATICGPAQAATVFLEDLTWTELRDEIVAGKTTVIVPIGGTEQNGPHMALGKHNVRVKALCAKDCARAGQRARGAGRVATSPRAASIRRRGTCAFPGPSPCPTRRSSGCSSRRRGASGCTASATSCFIGDHGDYQKSLTAVAARLNREWAASPRARPRHRRVLRGDQDRVRRTRSRAAATATPRSARTPGSPTRRCLGDRSGARPPRQARCQCGERPGRRRDRRSAPRRRPSWASSASTRSSPQPSMRSGAPRPGADDAQPSVIPPSHVRRNRPDNRGVRR